MKHNPLNETKMAKTNISIWNLKGMAENIRMTAECIAAGHLDKVSDRSTPEIRK